MNLSESHKESINGYIRAKDDNKPHLLKEVFKKSANLNMMVKSDAISFPSETRGLESITHVLVSNFSQQYEDVYTFCMRDSVISDEEQVRCKWGVVMTDKEEGNIRVGCGDYKWVFNSDMVEELTILIEEMIVLEKTQGKRIYCWLKQKRYPWCDSGEFLEELPQSISFLFNALTS